MHRPELVTAHDVPEERPGVEIALVALALVVAAGVVAVLPFAHSATVAIGAALVAALAAAAGTVREAVLVEERDWPPTEGLLLDLVVVLGAIGVVILAVFQ
jgi:branched-subunit amino acid ABC-type transport system permease component